VIIIFSCSPWNTQQKKNDRIGQIAAYLGSVDLDFQFWFVFICVTVTGRHFIGKMVVAL
jgi:hypothetical protein